MTFGYYTPVIVMMDADRVSLIETARLVVREIMREGFSARIETVNTMEAWLGLFLAACYRYACRPMIHTISLADLLPAWRACGPGRDANPCPFYPAGSPPLMHGATAGATPFRINLHVGDVGPYRRLPGRQAPANRVLLCAPSRSKRCATWG